MADRVPTCLDLATRLVDDGRSWVVPDGWQQGRGAFGGLVIAGMLRAVERAAGTDRALRSVSAQVLAPLLPGPAALAVETVRVGSAVSTYAVALASGGEVVARAVAVLGARRELTPSAPPAPPSAPPAAPPWEAVGLVPLGPPLAPVFMQHLQARPVRGIPLTGDADETVAWVAFAPGGDGPRADYDAVGLVALVDSLWPVALVAMAASRPMATLTFEAAVTVDPATLDPQAPLLYRGRTVAEHEGYLVEQRQLWTPDGRLAAHNVQTIVVIR